MTRTRSLFSIAAVAAIVFSVASIVPPLVAQVWAYCTRAVQAGKAVILRVLRSAAAAFRPALLQLMPRVALVVAKAYSVRVARRMRPRLTSSWRMIPSC